MTLENVKKYADKLGINENSFGASLENVNYTNNYFYGVKLSVPAIRFYFDYTECNYYTMQKKAEMIKKYCKRYGFVVAFNGGCFGVFAFSVLLPADYDNYSVLGYYTDGSKTEWEIMQHNEYSRGNYNINELGKTIMQTWENAYFERVNADKIVKFPA